MYEGVRFINVEYFFNKIADFLYAIGSALFGTRTDTGAIDVYNSTGTGALAISQQSGNAYHVFLFLVGFLFFVGICYFIYLSYEIRQAELEHVDHWHAPDSHAQVETANPMLQRWDKVVGLFNSSDHASWRLAIIEADTMLDELMQYLGFDGVSLGERLKSASPRVFPPLQEAWEVHNLRNKLAHEGLSYDLQPDEAIRARKTYENIFRGYNFI